MIWPPPSQQILEESLILAMLVLKVELNNKLENNLDREEYWPFTTGLKCHCDEISLFFFPLFFTKNNLPSCTMSFRPEKKIKRSPSLKFRRSKSEICRPGLFEIGSSWAHYFCSGNSACDVIYLTLDWWSLDFTGISVGFWLEYLQNFCWFRSSIWRKFVWKQ